MRSTRRAIRRHHRDRLLKNRRKKIWWAKDSDYTSRVVNTPCPCSCWMCGNPRKWLKEKTRQEYRSYLNFVEGIEEIDS